jgi:8-amino-7-oxononanoate synthase
MKISKFKQVETALGRAIEVDHRSYLYFGGTAYLGIPKNKEFLAHYIQGIELYGLNNGTSRSNNVQLNIYNEAEKVAATRFGAEEALITSSGYLAAQMTVRHFSTWGALLYAPATHPALWIDGNPDVSSDFSTWASEIVFKINQHKERQWVIVTNSLNNLFPEAYDFSFINKIDRDKEIVLIIDDSHGLGILNEGKGCLPDVPKLNNVAVIVLASMAKGLGVDAGLILGPHHLIQELKQTNVFFGASPPAAAGLHAFIKSEAIYLRELKKLKELIAYFQKGLDLRAYTHISGFPVYLSGDKSLSQKLLEAQVLISSFAYPDQNGELLNRIVLSSWHTLADLDKLLDLLSATP